MGEYSNQVQKAPWLCSQRLTLAVVTFLGFINLYSMRVNLSVAMVCMVNHTAHDGYRIENHTIQSTEQCETDGVNDTKIQSEDGELEWSKPVQGLVLSSFFWGYIVTQIPGGWLSTRYGGKRVIGWSIGTCALLTLFMPLAARTHPVFLMVLRVILGLCQGTAWSSNLALWSYWAPPWERSRLIAFSFTGVDVGNAVTIPTAGLLCKYGFAGGWPSIFYVGGTCGLVWFMAWMYIVYDTPELHPRITAAEKSYIQDCLTGQTTKTVTTRHVPWLALVKTPAVWALVVANFTLDWTMYTFLTNLPTYMREVLQFDIQKNALLSCLPYLGLWTVTLTTGVIADKLRSKGILTTTVVRKMFNTMGTIIPAILCISLGFIDCTQQVVGVVLLISAISLIGLVGGGGYVVNHTDVAPKYAALLCGISNCVASAAGFLAPTLIGFLTRDKTPAQWRQVFYVSAGITTFGSLFYLVAGSGEIQDWAVDKTQQSCNARQLTATEDNKDRAGHKSVEDKLLQQETNAL